MSAYVTDFESCVERKLMKDGTLEIHCTLGLWAVSGRDRHQVEREARHYWMQYLTGGEYTKGHAKPLNKKPRHPVEFANPEQGDEG